MDNRNLYLGYEIPKESYCDQPYIVIGQDHSWICTLTTSQKEEGSSSQHVVSTKSFDKGANWTKPIDIEPSNGTESSWVVPLKTPNGRIYAFYLCNSDNIRQVPCEQGMEPYWPPKICPRVDTIGHYYFKYSDDNGNSWSKERYEVPIRKMKIDFENSLNGEILYFWGVGKPIIHNGKCFLCISKVGNFGNGFIVKSECVFLCSENILTESDPLKITWATLPDGNEGLKSPIGPISEENTLVGLNCGKLFTTFRTQEGHNCFSYSNDDGHTWEKPDYISYDRDHKKKIKHPRAHSPVWKTSDGRYLLWFHNHSMVRKPIGFEAYLDRNPAWISCGIEENGSIRWSQPEILLYDDNFANRISYPDFFEYNGDYFLTETQKETARVHKIDKRILNAGWSQFDKKHNICKDGLIFTCNLPENGSKYKLPFLPDFSIPSHEGLERLRRGFTLDFWLKINDLESEQMILDTRDKDGYGFIVAINKGTIYITIKDIKNEIRWDSDPNLLTRNNKHHIGIVVDGGPNIITYVIDGMVCDGSNYRQFGWGRFKIIPNPNSSCEVKFNQSNILKITNFRLYNRYLLNSEVFGNWKTDYKNVNT